MVLLGSVQLLTGKKEFNFDSGTQIKIPKGKFDQNDSICGLKDDNISKFNIQSKLPSPYLL